MDDSSCSDTLSSLKVPSTTTACSHGHCSSLDEFYSVLGSWWDSESQNIQGERAKEKK